jgi:hypothetical protein
VDFAMCKAECCLAQTCRRHPKSGTKPDPNRQTYADFHDDGTGCDAYWHVGQQLIGDSDAV